MDEFGCETTAPRLHDMTISTVDPARLIVGTPTCTPKQVNILLTDSHSRLISLHNPSGPDPDMTSCPTALALTPPVTFRSLAFSLASPHRFRCGFRRNQASLTLHAANRD